MSDTTETTETPGWDRRRFIKASAGGAALVWAAPTITGLDARAFAAGSNPTCVTTLSDDFDDESTTPDSGGYSTQTSLTNFAATTGNVDVIGYAAPYIYFGGTEGLYIDLIGTGAGTTTVLESKADFCEGTYTVTVRYSADPRGLANGTISAALGNGSGSVAVPAGNGSSTAQSFTFSGTVPAGGGKLVITATSDAANNGPLLLEVTVA